MTRDLEYFSYSELLIKIEISVIVTPDDTLVNNDRKQNYWWSKLRRK